MTSTPMNFRTTLKKRYRDHYLELAKDYFVDRSDDVATWQDIETDYSQIHAVGNDLLSELTQTDDPAVQNHRLIKLLSSLVDFPVSDADTFREEDVTSRMDAAHVQEISFYGLRFGVTIAKYVEFRYIGEAGRLWLLMGLVCAVYSRKDSAITALTAALGNWNHHRGRLQEALAYFKQVVSFEDQPENQKSYARALHYLGATLFEMGQKQQALQAYRQALENLRGLDDTHRLKSQLFNSIAMVIASSGDMQQAIRYFEEALEISQQFNLRITATILNNLAGLYEDIGNVEMALSYYRQALDYYEARQDKWGQGLVLNNVGLLHYNYEYLDEAIELFDKAVPLLEAVSDQIGLAGALNNIGLALRDLERFDEACTHFKRALTIYESLGASSGRATALSNVGLSLLHMEDHDDGLAHLQQALELHRQLNNRPMEATTLNNIGGYFFQKGNQPEALSYFKKALAIREKLNNKRETAISYYNVACLIWDIGDKQDAIEKMKKSRQLKLNVGLDTFEEDIILLDWFDQLNNE